MGVSPGSWRAPLPCQLVMVLFQSNTPAQAYSAEVKGPPMTASNTTTSTTDAFYPSKFRDVLYGCAYGDAWGNRNEFQSYKRLTANDKRGPELPATLIVTDDTQMTLSLARAIHTAGTHDLDCRDAAKIDKTRLATMTNLRRVAKACQSSLQKPSSVTTPGWLVELRTDFTVTKPSTTQTAYACVARATGVVMMHATPMLHKRFGCSSVRLRGLRLLECGLQVWGCGAVGVSGDVFGGAGGDDAAAVGAGSGSEVDDMVGLGDDAHVEFDHDYGVAGIDEALGVGEQAVAVGGMETGGGLVEDVEGVTSVCALELGGEFDPLGLAAGELGGWLSES